MKTPLFCLLFLLLTAVTAFPQAKNAKADAEETLKQLEKRRYELMIKKDLAALREMLADDLVYTHSNGVTENKEQYLAGLASGKSVYYAVEPVETQVRLYGNMAILNGIANVDTEVNGQKTTLRLKYTDAYVKRNGKWQFVTWQSLRMAQ
jgi:ketosteroid isomerase-like protein